MSIQERKERIYALETLKRINDKTAPTVARMLDDEYAALIKESAPSLPPAMSRNKRKQ